MTKLEGWRKANGLSLQEVSDLTGYSVAMIFRVERGEREFSRDAKVRFARALEVPIGHLFDSPARPDLDEPFAESSTQNNPAPRRRRRAKITDAMLREVAEVYRANVADDPTGAVAKHFGKKRQMATIYIKRAVARELLWTVHAVMDDSRAHIPVSYQDLASQARS